LIRGKVFLLFSSVSSVSSVVKKSDLMRLKQALDSAVSRLEENAVGSPRMNAELLLMFTLSCDRAYLYAHPERELTAPELTRYDETLVERSRGVPAQYITGHQEFWGLDLVVSPAVLIPRPETEHIVETVLALARGDSPLRPNMTGRGTGLADQEDPDCPLRMVDVGTGSGCIALALATELPRAEIWATDISPAALEIARANAARLQLAERVCFRQGDLLEGMAPPEARFDFVISNPPYVGEGEADKLQREVKKFEPKEAVFAGAQGLDVFVRLIPQACHFLRPGGWLVMEMGYSQEEPVRALLSEWREVQVVPDLQGILRVILAKAPKTAPDL
jgi:release factor glutamine methyltransferase